MVMPLKGDYGSAALNANGRRAADTWTPDQAGRCELVRRRGRHARAGTCAITWENDSTLRIETEAGKQTRHIPLVQSSSARRSSVVAGHVRGAVGRSARTSSMFSGPMAFDNLNAGQGAAARRMVWTPLKVVTTNLRAGWLRANGVPYSAQAVITEDFMRFAVPEAGNGYLRSSKRPYPLVRTRRPGKLRRVSPVRVRRWQDRRARTCGAGAAFLLNAPFAADEVWNHLPREMQGTDHRQGRSVSSPSTPTTWRSAPAWGRRINTIMQTCFFAISGLLPRDRSDQAHQEGHRENLRKTRPGGGAPEQPRSWIRRWANLHEVDVPAAVSARHGRPPLVSERAPDFVQKVTAVMLAGKGDLLPVSAFPVDGTWPMATAKWEKRNIALEIPVWDSKVCVQCNQCALRVPACGDSMRRSTTRVRCRARRRRSSRLPIRGNEHKGKLLYDPGGTGGLHGLQPVRQRLPGQGPNQPETQGDRHASAGAAARRRARQLRLLPRSSLRWIEPRYHTDRPQELAVLRAVVRILGRVRRVRRDAAPQDAHCSSFGDRLLIANATGCSSIYGGNLPTTPYTTNRDGRGPAWSNSLFEDNAEFGFGFRLALDAHVAAARGLVQHLALQIGDGLVTALLEADQTGEAGIAAQRDRVRCLAAAAHRSRIRGSAPASKHSPITS